MNQEYYDELASAVDKVNELHNLDDAIYVVKGVGNGWDGPNVVTYADAVGVITKHLRVYRARTAKP